MTVEDYLALSATNLIRHSPVLLVGVIGLWYAVPMRHQLSRAAIWASWGFGLLIAHAITSVARDVASVAIRANNVLEPTDIGLALTFWSLVAYLPLLLALVLLARAFFLDRR